MNKPWNAPKKSDPTSFLMKHNFFCKSTFISTSWVCLFIGILFSCGKPNTDLTRSCQSGYMTISLAGVAYDSIRTRCNLFFDNSTGEQSNRLFFRMAIDSGDVNLTITNWKWQSPPPNGVLAKSYYFFGVSDSLLVCNNNFCEGAEATYIKNLSESGIYFHVENDIDQYFDLDHINTSSKRVSGSFYCKLVNDSGDTISLTGIFNDLCYTVSE